MKVVSALVLAALGFVTSASANSFSNSLDSHRFEDRYSRRCYGQRYEWSQVGHSYVCYLTELRWSRRLATCEWNRVQPVSDLYCR